MTILVPNKGYLKYDVEFGATRDDCLVRTYQEYLSARYRRMMVKTIECIPKETLSKHPNDEVRRWAKSHHKKYRVN